MTIDVVSLILSAVGVLLGAAGVVIALVQIRGARRAAEQARDAAREAAGRVRSMQAAVDLSRVSADATDVVLHPRADNFPSAAEAALRVRKAVALVRLGEDAGRLAPPASWQALAARVAQTQEAAERLARLRRRSHEKVLLCIESASDVVEQVAALAGVAAGRAARGPRERGTP